MRRGFLLWVLAAGIAAHAEAQTAAPVAAASLTDAEKERFLLEAEVVKTKSAPGGITGSTRATLRGKDGFEHDAHIQMIDEAQAQKTMATGIEIDFRDSYRNNVAAYRLDRMLGLGMAAVTVVRVHEGKKASFMWWVDDVMMSERKRLDKKLQSPDVEAWNRQMYVVRVFDQVIYNFDRNLDNLLISQGWRIWMIDHSRAFKIFKQLKSPKDLGPQCERGLLAGLRRLDAARLKTAMKDLLNEGQIEGLLARRDIVVEYYDEKIAALGEDAVLYDLPWRVSEPAAASR